MAITNMSGFETGTSFSAAASSTSVNGVDGAPGPVLGTPVIQSSVVRSGNYALQCNSGGASNSVYQTMPYNSTTSGIKSWASRVYVRFDVLPAATAAFMTFNNGFLAVKLTTAGKIQLFNGVTQRGSDSVSTIAINK